MLNCYIPAQTASLNTTVSNVPGDKSISHRAFIIGGLATNASQFSNVLESEDCLNTLKIMQALGIDIQEEDGIYTIEGKGLNGLRMAPSILDVGNSGTGIRLLAGLLSAQQFHSTLTGDSSIQGRPMRRVMDPLTSMGASIQGQVHHNDDDRYPPLTVSPADALSSYSYQMPIASAQVKSALLLAGLYVDELTITEPELSRDHTERLLRYFGADLTQTDKTITLKGKKELENPNPNTLLRVPSDISSSLFLLILGGLLPKTKMTLTSIGTNSTRAGVLEVLKKMNIGIQIDEKPESWEPIADITVQSSRLHNHSLSGAIIPNIIDEIPILSVAALFAQGQFSVRDAEELRVKESDRISSIVQMVEAMGCTITESSDGFDIEGPQTIQSFQYSSGGDHRMAMSAIIAAIASGVEATIENCDCIRTSFPNFFDILKELGIDFQLVDR